MWITQSYVGYAMYKEGNVSTKSAVMRCWYAQINSSCLSLAYPQKSPKDHTIFYIMPLIIHTFTLLEFFLFFFFFFKNYFASSMSILFEANFKIPHVKQFLSYTFSNYFYIDVSP